MTRSLLACSLLLTFAAAAAAQVNPFAAGVRTTPWLKPAEEQRGFQLPPGFEIQLVAAEPQIAKPLNLAFDERGRLWVTDTLEYPYAAPLDKPGRDSIKVLEDTDGDGAADKIITFADGLNIPIGLYPWRGGVICFSIPNIWHLEDTDGDGRCDKRTVLLGPFDYSRDTHGLNNAFRRGFDGWLYACHGFNNASRVRGQDGREVVMQSGNTYRFRLDGSRIEHFTWGQVNPFGMTLDPLFNLFTADCHSKPVYQLLRGGYYPSFGKPHDGLGFVPPMMEHLHGSTAIAGVARYEGDLFPAEFRGHFFSGNVMTSRINRNAPVYHGSTIEAAEEPDFLSSADPWFRPVDLVVGPDGALYVADFYNKIIGHYEVPLTHPERDRTSGRIWRISYRGMGEKPAARAPDLSRASAAELIAAMDHPTLTVRMLAMHRLADEIGPAGAADLAAALAAPSSPRQQTHLLWTLWRLDRLEDSQLAAAARDDSRDVRVHAMKILSEQEAWQPAERRLALTGLQDEDAFVARAAADAVGRHPERAQIKPLLARLARTPAADNHLAQVLRMALRDHVAALADPSLLAEGEWPPDEARHIAGVAVAVKTAAAAELLVRHLARQEEPREKTLAYLQHAAQHAAAESVPALIEQTRARIADDVDLQLGILSAIHSGLAQRGQPAAPELAAWGEALAGRLLEQEPEPAWRWTNAPAPGRLRSDEPWVTQVRSSADGDKQSPFYCSLPKGESLTGVFRSAPFPLPESLSFYCAGHSGPTGQPLNDRNVIRLRDAEQDEVLVESRPPRNDTAQKITWNLARFAGRRGYVEVVDADAGTGFAWLAVGRFSLPQLNPPRTLGRQQAAAELAGKLKLKSLAPRLGELCAAQKTEPAVRAAAALALASLEPDARVSALAVLLADASLSASQRAALGAVAARRDPGALAAALRDAMKSAPLRLQTALAEQLAADAAGADALVSLAEQGVAAATLLRAPGVAGKLAALQRRELSGRVAKLVAALPPANQALDKLIAERKAAYPQARPVAARGAELFGKHCAGCHQVAGKGALVGPQLDGVGNRGLERLLEDLLDPNRNVDVAFRTTTLVLKDGSVFAGLLRREEGATLVLADQQGKERAIPKAEIEQQVRTNLSLMPANVAEIISAEDFPHLVAHLLELRGGPAK